MNSYFNKFVGNSIPFMGERERADIKELADGRHYHIISDYGFIKSKQDKNSDYAVFCVKERAGVFFFGGSAITAALHTISDDNQREALAQEAVKFVTYESRFGNEGIAIRFGE